MNPSTATPVSSLVDEAARRRFESAWVAGRPEPIEHFLPPEDQPRYLPTLEELVQIELEFAWKGRGPCGPDVPTVARPAPRIEDYLGRFPRLNQSPILARLVEQEFRVRQVLGDEPTLEEYQQRFPTLEIKTEVFKDTPASRPAAEPVPAIPGFEVLEELGRGGQSVVFKARQLSLNRLVALKRMLAGTARNGEDRARFGREANAVAHLKHPHIVQIYEIGEHAGDPYFALEFVAGGTLAKKLAGKPLLPREAAQLIETVARAMQKAHEAGIVHRDLKPGNILLEPDGTPKITDFGLAKQLEAGASLTQTGLIMGTPAYMAPEQATGQSKEVGVAADVYALGAVLFECLTGRPPFRGATSLDLLRQVVSQEAESPRQLQSGIARDLDTICLKCLCKEPERRYCSAEDLANDLQRFQAGLPIQARPASKAERLWRWCRRNVALAFVSAVAATAVLLLAILLAIQAQHGPSSHADAPPPSKTDKPRVPTPRPNGPLIFQDDFTSSEPTAQALFGPNYMEFVNSNGEGRLSGKASPKAPVVVLPALYPAQVDNFFVDCHVDLPADSPVGTGYGLLFRSDRNESGLPRYYALWFYPRQAEAQIVRWENAKWTTVKEYPWRIQWNMGLRLEVEGNRFRVFVDQTFLFEATDDNLSGPGLICLVLVTTDDKVVSKAVFRNLRVYKPGA